MLNPEKKENISFSNDEDEKAIPGLSDDEKEEEKQEEEKVDELNEMLEKANEKKAEEKEAAKEGVFNFCREDEFFFIKAKYF